MKTMQGSLAYPFDQMVKDTIRTHGLHFAVQYYCKRHGLSGREFRVFSGI